MNFINHQKEKSNNKQTRAQIVASLSLSPASADFQRLSVNHDKNRQQLLHFKQQ